MNVAASALSSRPTVVTVGMDVGTTRVKAVAYDLDGAQLTIAERPTPWRHDGDDTEMDVAAFNECALGVLAELGEQVAGQARIAAVGVTGMAESGVLAHEGIDALAPIRAWHDTRGDIAQIAERVGAAAFSTATGLALTPTASLAKILRLQQEFPDCRAATRFYSLPEWVVVLLGGEPGSEASLASRTGLLDVLAGRSWSPAARVLGGQLLGDIRDAGAPATPGRHGCPLPRYADAVLTVGGHDHQCAAFAVGAVRTGTLFDSLGTAEALVRITASGLSGADVLALVNAGLTVGRTVIPGHLCLMAGMETGRRLEALAERLGARTAAERPRLAADRRWLDGVDEIVAAAAPKLAAMTEHAGAHERVIVAGGWVHDEVVMAAKRAQLGTVQGTMLDEAGTRGAAWFAASAAGLLMNATKVGRGVA